MSIRSLSIQCLWTELFSGATFWEILLQSLFNLRWGELVINTQILRTSLYHFANLMFTSCQTKKILNVPCDGTSLELIFWNWFCNCLSGAVSQCVKSVRIRSYSSSYFSPFGLNTDWMRENADQNNSQCEHLYAVCETKRSNQKQ